MTASTTRTTLLAAALLLGSLPRIDAVSRLYPPDRDQRSDVRRYYASAAESMLEGKGFLPSYPTNFIPPPGQAFFIYACKRLLPGCDYLHMRSLQALVSVLTILLAWRAASRVYDAWAGVACAWLVALNYRLSELCGTLVPETNYICALLAFFVVLLEVRPGARRGVALAAGLLLGTACLFKPLPTLLAPCAAALVAWQARGAGRAAALRAGGLLLAGFLATTAPWVLRNLAHYGHLYPISTNGGTLLALANSGGVDSSRPDMVFWDELRTQGRWLDPGIEARYAGVLDADAKPEENLKDRAYLRKAAADILRSPLSFLRNYAVKLGNFLWHPDDGGLAEAAGPWPFRTLPRFFPTLAALALVGAVVLWRTRRREPASAALLLLLGYLWAFGALYHLTRDGRMNLPLRTLLSIPASVALSFTLARISPATRLRRSRI